MSETIDQMIGHILEHEGGFTDNPNDPGGPTNCGISLRFLQSVNPRATIEDIRNMTPTEAAGLYKRYFFQQPHFDTLPAELQPMMFDEAVNFGAPHAINCLDKAISARPIGYLDEGSRTVLSDVVRRIGMQATNNAIVDQFCAAYDAIAKANPKELRFLAGWKRRAISWRMATMMKLRPQAEYVASRAVGSHWTGLATP